MSEVFIPLGGVNGKNRGTTAVLGDGTPFINSGSEMNLPLPAGIYKKVSFEKWFLRFLGLRVSKICN